MVPYCRCVWASGHLPQILSARTATASISPLLSSILTLARCGRQAVAPAGTRATSDPARHRLTYFGPRSPDFAHSGRAYDPGASPAMSSGGGQPTAEPSASLEAAFRRGWEAAATSSPPPAVLAEGYAGGHRLSSSAAPFSPGLGGFGVDPGGFGGAARRGVQVRSLSGVPSHSGSTQLGRPPQSGSDLGPAPWAYARTEPSVLDLCSKGETGTVVELCKLQRKYVGWSAQPGLRVRRSSCARSATSRAAAAATSSSTAAGGATCRRSAPRPMACRRRHRRLSMAACCLRLLRRSPPLAPKPASHGPIASR